MARTRSASYDDQRELILAQAAALFARQGYAGTSMNEVAAACGLSKASLYHYFRDKYALLLEIADGHVSHLDRSIAEVVKHNRDSAAEDGLRRLIERIVHEYADAENAHRVLTEDVRFLEPEDRTRVLDKQRRLVEAFARAVAAVRPDADAAGLVKPLTMLLFGMVNWMFTWHRSDGPLTHDALAPLVASLFTAGVSAVSLPPGSLASASFPASDRPKSRTAPVSPTAALTPTTGDNA